MENHINPNYGNTPKMKELLTKYNRMKQEGTKLYFEPDELTILAEHFAKMENAEESEQVIDYALELYPENLDIIIYKCQILLSNGQLEQVKQLINTIPDTTDYSVLLIKAEISILEEKYTEAFEIVDYLYEEDPSIETLIDIAHLYLNHNLIEEVEPWLEKASQKENDNYEVIELLADYYSKVNKLEEAIEFYNKLLDENPYDLSIWHQIARCYLRMDNPEKALESLDFANIINEDDYITKELAAYCFIMLDNVDKSLALLLELKQKTTKQKFYVNSIILECYCLKNDTSKILEYSQILLDDQETPDYMKADIYYKRANAYFYEMDNTKSMNEIMKGLSYDNNEARLYLLKGKIHLAYDQMEEAETAFHQNLLLTNDKAESLLEMAYEYFFFRHFKRAASIYSEVERIAPERMYSYYYTAAFCFFKNGDLDRMHEYLIRTAISYPEKIMTVKYQTFDDQEEVEHSQFHKTALDILQKVQNSEIDITPYKN